jgi:hypothetical protein
VMLSEVVVLVLQNRHLDAPDRGFYSQCRHTPQGPEFP